MDDINRMQGLSEFKSFDIDGFLDGKTLKVFYVGEWKDYNSHEHLGTNILVKIIEDNTEYKGPADNVNAKFAVKIARDITVPVGAIISLVEPAGKVYGKYQNQLSVRCKDFVIVNS